MQREKKTPIGETKCHHCGQPVYVYAKNSRHPSTYYVCNMHHPNARNYCGSGQSWGPVPALDMIEASKKGSADHEQDQGDADPGRERTGDDGRGGSLGGFLGKLFTDE